MHWIANSRSRESTSQSLGQAAQLQRIRSDEGAVPESDYRQAESQYQEAVARVPELERQIAQQENFISVLLGQNPGPIPRGRDIDRLLFPAVPDGLPASLLERRPDIREAEENLIAANADIGVAKAAYYPNISLTGQHSAWKVPSSRICSKVLPKPGLSAPVYCNRFSMPVASAVRSHRPKLCSDRPSTPTKSRSSSAFQDVDNALIDRTKFLQVREEQAKNVLALFRFRDLALLRYTEGATIYLEVANAEQSLFLAQLAFVTTQAQLFQSYANLYKAMGGGWVEEAEGLASNKQGGDAENR